MIKPPIKILLTATLLFITAQSHAHVSFIVNSAILPIANTTFVATLNVSHGCTGADTRVVEVTIPDGVTSVKPTNTAFGTATIEKTNDVITKLIWTKSSAALPADDHYYQLVFRMKLPNTPLTSIQFHTVQKCGPSESEVILDWAAESPVLNLLPARKPGWNQYTTQVDVTNLSTFFSDAYIVWLGTAAYSANTVTAGLISNTLNSLPSGSTFWVKY